MWSQLIDPIADKPRAKLFWAVAGVVLLGQLVASYMLCSQQVRNADARKTAIQVQRTAINDCLQYLPNATVGGCASQVAALRPEGSLAPGISALTESRNAGVRDAGHSAWTSAVPVNFVFR